MQINDLEFFFFLSFLGKLNLIIVFFPVNIEVSLFVLSNGNLHCRFKTLSLRMYGMAHFFPLVDPNSLIHTSTRWMNVCRGKMLNDFFPSLPHHLQF